MPKEEESNYKLLIPKQQESRLECWNKGRREETTYTSKGIVLQREYVSSQTCNRRHNNEQVRRRRRGREWMEPKV